MMIVLHFHRCVCWFCVFPLLTGQLGAWLLSQRGFSELSCTSELKIGTPVATLPGAWCNGVSALTGWPGVSIL